MRVVYRTPTRVAFVLGCSEYIYPSEEGIDGLLDEWGDAYARVVKYRAAEGRRIRFAT